MRPWTNSTPRLNWRRKASDAGGPLVARCAERSESRGVPRCAGESRSGEKGCGGDSGGTAKSLAFIALGAKAGWTALSRNPLRVCHTSSLTRLRRLPEASASSFSTSSTPRAIGLRDAGRNLEAVGYAGLDAAAGGAALSGCRISWACSPLPHLPCRTALFPAKHPPAKPRAAPPSLRQLAAQHSA